MTVRIVTDSGSDLSPEVAETLGIAVVPLTIRFGSTEFTDRVDLTPEQFYAEMESRDELPETAAPAPGAFAEAFRSLIADGASSIVCINLSEALSATAQAARTAATTIDGTDIHIVDSKSATVGQGNLVARAAEAAAAGADAQTIIRATEELSARTHVLGILDTLENLKKGGRIGNAQAMIGSMLSIKPCIDLSTGEVEEAGRQRTRKKALAWLAGQLPSGAQNVAIGHGLAPDIDTFLGMLDAEIDRVSLIGPVVGTHGGPRVIGMTYTV
jgi:DegV family protein with EDD domain